MDYSIFNDILLDKILKRKLRRNVVKAAYDLEWLSFDRKVSFAYDMLTSIPYTKGRIIIMFWEKTELMIRLLESFCCDNWKIQRSYIMGRVTPGIIELPLYERTNKDVLHSLITKQFGFEHGKKDSLSLQLCVAFEDEVYLKILHLYDDRGFYLYEVRRL